MKRVARFLFCALLSFALLPHPTKAQTVYAVGKVARYAQSGSATFALNSGVPFEFSAIGSVLGTVTTPTAQVEQLTFSTNDQDYEATQNFATQAALDQAFPSGTYIITLLGHAPVNMPFGGDLYPPVPLITNGSWSIGDLLIDPANPVVLNFSPFPEYASPSAPGQVSFALRDDVGTELVGMSWTSLSGMPMPTGITIPAGTLTPGEFYTGSIDYGSDPTVDETSVPGAFLFTTYITSSTFVIIGQAPDANAPVATSQPESQTVESGAPVVFNFTANGSPTPSLQWSLNGKEIPSATGSVLVIEGTTAADAGSYTCVASNGSGTLTSSVATLSVVTTNDPGRLINLSARAEVGTGGNIVFGGFAIGPQGTTGALPVLIRASGPAIAAAPFNVPGTLADPQLQLFDSSDAVLETNNGWNGNASVSATAAAVGAFAWTVPTSHDAALNFTLASGPYTAQVSGQDGDKGDALVEVYDATPAGTYTASLPRLVNLSARVDVGTGANALFAGFVIGGSTSLTVLIRASGPSIASAPFNVPGTLADPELTLQNPSTGAVYATNNTWIGDANISAAAASVGAFKWSDPTSHDSALLITLPPGNYTAEASGATGDSGVALVEVYEVP
jgi:hypothetical protein